MYVKPKTLDNLDLKAFEADFFLSKMVDSENGIEMFALSYYLSAFLTSTRSITFALQSTCAGLPGFEGWYESKRSMLSSDPLAKSFLYARNESEKEGVFHIRSGAFSQGKAVHFMELPLNDKGTIRKEFPVIEKSDEYFKKILSIILDLYVDYGVFIDPDQYYSLDGLKFHGKSLEDIEEDLIGRRGWTYVSGIPDEERIKMLLRNESKSRIGELFWKYLKQEKPGFPNVNALMRLKKNQSD